MTDAKKPAPGKMQAFKIGDAVKQAVERPRIPSKGGQRKEAAGPAPSVGFPRIEALVESDAPDLSGLEARAAELAELARAAKAQKDKLSAQRAAKAYQKAKALLEQLFATKSQLRGGGGG